MFVADPYGAGDPYVPHRRPGKWRADGQLEFVGRVDHQVKVRGFRIELGEIGDGAAGPSRGRPGGGDGPRGPARRPAARGVRGAPRGRERPGPEELRPWVARTLPEYMVPSAFVLLDSFPLTPNGKLDRGALPAPAAKRARGPQRPRGPREELLCGLFAEVLGLDEVGVHDDFFRLGGHSLLATRLTSRVRTALGAEPRCGTCSRRRRPRRWPGGWTGGRGAPRTAAAGEAAGPRPPVVRPAAAVVPAPAGGAEPDVQRAAGAAPVGRAGRGRAARRARRPGDPAREPAHRVPAAGRHPVPAGAGGDAARPVFEVVRCGPEDLDGRVSGAARYAFDLTAQPPLRSWLFETAPDEHTLLLLAHHIACDGASLAPLGDDLAAAYTARLAGRAPEWEPLPAQYADYTLWQREALGDEADPDSLLSGQVAYWRAALAGIPDQLELPADRPRPAVAGHHGDRVGFTWDTELHTAVVRLAREHQCSVFMVLQAGLAALPDAARRGHGHSHRHAGRGPGRRGAGPAGRLLRQHPRAAHRHLGRPLLRGSCSPGSGRPTCRPTPTRTCPSSGWWRSSTRSGRRRTTRCSRSC